MALKKPNPVQGYMFSTVLGCPEAERNDTICKIIKRLDGGIDTLEYGPAFEVEFGDGLRMMARSNELAPWYQTD